MMFQLICFDVLVMLSFMFPRLGSSENGFLAILIYTESRLLSSFDTTNLV